ncbi:Hsp70 family protein [Catenibacterium mitsuokai]|uniref:Hsp70 family protein n=1 Tax=Catenibacterium mitsuokai TaxID=100886 RepID=UPI003F8C1A5D
MNEDKKYVLGCDIGNGYGYVSLLMNENEDPVSLFPSKYGLTKIGMPTAAYVTPPDGKEIVVFKNGKTAESIYKSKPAQMVRAIKTRFKEKTINIPNIDKPVETGEIYSAITRDLIYLAEEELKNKNIKPVNDIVFTFPAAFADNVSFLEMMQKNIEKIKINGNKINVLGRLPEPAAVAIDYLHYMQHIAPKDIRIKDKKFTVLVYDLGHGTFDTAVVTAQSEGTPYVLHSKAGLPEIGGKNFDEILYQELVNVLEEQYDYVPKNERMREIVREEAINKKIELSDNEIVSASVFNGNDYYDVELTRERFEELTEHLLIQTLELVQDVLNESSSAGIKIDAIVLSGGASQMPMVLNGLKELVEDEYPVVLYRPSEAVSFGAARFAYGISRTKPIPGLKPDSSSSQTHKNRTVKVSEKKEITTETGKSNQIMEQLTDCCYGLWMPSENNLEGEVEFMIQSGKSRPITSDKVEFFTASSRLVLKLYRSKEKNRNLKSATIKECDSILWVPFDVIPGKKYEASITVLENYGIEVELHAETGEIVKKTTSDFLSKLI